MRVMIASDLILAARIHRFCPPPEVIRLEKLPMPNPGPGEVRVRIAAAGVGPWDAWVRAGKSALPQALPLTLGSDLAGIVDPIHTGSSSCSSIGGLHEC